MSYRKTAHAAIREMLAAWREDIESRADHPMSAADLAYEILDMLERDDG